MEEINTVSAEIKVCIEAALYAAQMAASAGFDREFVGNVAQLAFHGQYAMFERAENLSLALMKQTTKRNA